MVLTPEKTIVSPGAAPAMASRRDPRPLSALLVTVAARAGADTKTAIRTERGAMAFLVVFILYSFQMQRFINPLRWTEDPHNLPQSLPGSHPYVFATACAEAIAPPERSAPLHTRKVSAVGTTPSGLWYRAGVCAGGLGTGRHQTPDTLY